MDFSDIPVIRHLPLAANSLKVVGWVGGLVVFPLIMADHMYLYAQAKSASRKCYEAFQTLQWFGISYVLWLLTIGMYYGFKANGTDWFYGDGYYLSSWLTSAEPYDRFMYDLTITAAAAAVGWLGSACCGHMNTDDTFAPHW